MAVDRLDASVVQSARANAPDLYLAGLLANRARQRDLVALAALVGDLAAIPVRVSEPMIGHIRLQWWSDWLESREPSGNAIADAVASLFVKHPDVTSDVRTMLEAQHNAIDALAGDRADDHQHETGTFFAAAFLAANHVLKSQKTTLLEQDAEPSRPSADLLQPAGFAYGTAYTLLLLRSYAKHGLWPFPEAEAPRDETPARNVAQSDRRRPAPDQLEESFPSNLVTDTTRVQDRRRSVEAAISAARTQLETMDAQYYAPSRHTAHALLPLALVEPYFQSFESTVEDPLMSEAGIAPFARHWALLRAWWRLPAQ